MSSAALAVLATAFLVAPPANALALPTPREFVSNLDLECFRTTPYQPPSVTLALRHLNPVLVNFPIGQVTLGQREQLCVPVAKNNVLPPPNTIDYLRFVDLSCYRVTGTALDQSLSLRHLNPVLQSVPGIQVVLDRPEHLCVPVAKNGLVPAPDVLRVISHIDLLCYAHRPNVPMNRALALQQLNPVLTGQIPTASVRVTDPRQLCVPVLKAGDTIPPDVLDIVRWIDLERYDIIAPAIPQVTLSLRHLNPVLAGLPGETATLTGALQLAVPVAKNGQVPPG
ncbi:hypothetical protein [Nonomuraea jiangxiensis]|uniref:hypothetical protein n=1 Tax=Nonomuraea jiangxiensis TaxID=633440 RepID=UPI001FE4309A|nr:hypothetical protein [Nonomuraea jiangxiensis]